jgi:hypothetical protein
VRFPGTLTSFAAADAAIALAIFCAGSWLGVAAVRGFQAAGGTPYFYQSEFGPAVMVACGRGFQGPDLRTEPALAAFLLQQSDAFDCTQLAPAVATVALTPFQRASEYLEFAVAMTWKVTGVSWSKLVILPGAFFGAVAALTYGVLRLGLSRLFALLALVPSVISTPNFMIVPQLRDYSKGPFLLAAILLMGALVMGSADRRRIVGLSGIGGAVIGIGLGFRFDLVIAVLPFVLTAAFLVPSGVTPSTRILAIAAFLAALAAATAPLLRGPSGNGSNAGHVALLGLSVDFDRPLRVEPSIYEFAGQYNDSLAFSIINSYAIRVEDQRRGVDLSTSAYDRAALGYLTQLARVFPADLVTRIVSASRTIPKYFLDSSLFAPIQVQSAFVRDLYSLRGRILWRLAPLGFIAVVLATLMVGVVNVRAACLVALVIAGFAGASAVQFDERHFYYLQFIPWFAFAVLARAVMDGRASLGRLTTRHAAQALMAGVALCLGLGAAIVLSRAYQQRSAARLFERYEAAPRTPLSIVEQPAPDDRMLITTPQWQTPMPASAARVDTTFVAVQLRDDACGPGALPLTIRYRGRTADVDLSQTLAVPLHPHGAAATMVFTPAYDRADESVRFRGVEVPTDRTRCVGGLFLVEGLDRTPLLLTTVLASNWRDEALHQRLH